MIHGEPTTYTGRMIFGQPCIMPMTDDEIAQLERDLDQAEREANAASVHTANRGG